MKMIAGAASFACWNRSRTREAPTPTNISTNSEAEIEKNGTLRLARERAREQRLASAGRAGQQHAARDPAPQPAVLVRLLEEVDDLGQLRLGLVDPSDVVEVDCVVERLDPLGP